MNNRSVGIFAKEPRPGRVKSRLASASSPEWAARVADALLRDTVARLARINARRFLVYSPNQAKEYFATLAGNQYQLISQEEGDLGRRMEQFIIGQLRTGARHIIIVGTDSPTMPAAWIERAFQELEQADLVIGPATDGGYNLLGCSGPPPPIFTNISWGSEKVLWETISRLSDLSLRVTLLPPCPDVDTIADLWALKGQIAALRRASLEPGIPHTERLLQDFS